MPKRRVFLPSALAMKLKIFFHQRKGAKSLTTLLFCDIKNSKKKIFLTRKKIEVQNPIYSLTYFWNQINFVRSLHLSQFSSSPIFPGNLHRNIAIKVDSHVQIVLLALKSRDYKNVIKKIFIFANHNCMKQNRAIIEWELKHIN